MKLIPPERYPDLIQLINRTYADEVEQILSAGADENGTIICLAQDGNKQLAIEIGDDDIQIRLFNPQAITEETAQLTAFVSLITQAQQGGWSPDMVRTSLQISFPSVPGALLDKMAESMKAVTAPGADPNNSQTPAPSPQTPEQAAQSLDAVAAQFAAGDIKAKKCMAGLSCGGSCISKTKVCKRALSIEQQKAFKELKKRLKGGDLGPVKK